MPSNSDDSPPEEENSQTLDESDFAVVDNLRKSWEIEDHWKLRRDFILTHMNKYPRSRLLCLAQLFVNVETLGNTYAAELMQEIRRLGEDVQALDEFKQRKAEIEAGEQFKPPPKAKQANEANEYRVNPNFQQQLYGNRSGYNRQQQNSEYNRPYAREPQQYGQNNRGQQNQYGRNAQNYGHQPQQNQQRFQPREQRFHHAPQQQQQSRQSYYTQPPPAYGQVVERSEYQASYHSASSSSEIPSYESVPSNESANQHKYYNK